MIGDCESERIWKLIESSRSLQTAARKKSSSTLLEHINNVYADISEKLQDKRFTVPVNVLEQLLGGVVKASVVIDLLPGHEGYTVSLSNHGSTAGSHTHQRNHQITLPYEDTELLDYLDAGHIPPVLLELIDRTHCCQLVDGCLVVELRNHRGYHDSPEKFSQHYFLLRPTAQSVIAAVNHAVNIHKGTDDDGLQLESKILLATQPPLCLDTSTDVTCVANRLQYNRHKFHTHSIKRYLKRRAQAVLTRAHMMQNAPPPKYLRLHQIIPRGKQAAATRDLSSHDPTANASLALPAAPDELLQEVSSRLPVAKEVTPVSSKETPKQLDVVTTTTSQVPLLMKKYDENADQYLVKPTKAPTVIPISIPLPTTAVAKPPHPKILSPIEKPYVFISTVHPTSGHRTIMRQPVAPPPRMGPGVAMMRPQLPMPRPIPSIGPVRLTKATIPPTTTTSTLPRLIPAQAKVAGNTAVKAIPIVSSPAVNIITPASIIAQITANKPVSVAISNPISISRPISVATSNPSVTASASVTPVTTVVSVTVNKNVTTNVTIAPVGVTSLKIRPSYQGQLPLLIRRPNQNASQRPAQPIQKPATPPPMLRASSPIPPPRPPRLQMAPRLTGPQNLSAQKPRDLPPPPVLPRMPTLQRGPLRSSVPTTTTK